MIGSAIAQVHRALRRQSPQPQRALEPEQLSGWCELAEAIAYHHLQDQGVPASQLHSNQVVELGGQFRHAFLVVEGSSQASLVDPTFGQFLHQAPGQALQTTAPGRKLLAQLLEAGHAPWNRTTAQLYGEAFAMPESPWKPALASQRPMSYQPSLFRSLLQD